MNLNRKVEELESKGTLTGTEKDFAFGIRAYLVDGLEGAPADIRKIIKGLISRIDAVILR